MEDKSTLQDIKEVIEMSGLTKCGNYDCAGCEFDKKPSESKEFGDYNVCVILNAIYRAWTTVKNSREEEIMNNTAVLLIADDWEGLYVNGRLVEEGHTLNEGNSRIKYFTKLAKQYKFDLADLEERYLDDSQIDELENNGNLEEDLSYYIGLL